MSVFEAVVKMVLLTVALKVFSWAVWKVVELDDEMVGLTVVLMVFALADLMDGELVNEKVVLKEILRADLMAFYGAERKVEMLAGMKAGQ